MPFGRGYGRRRRFRRRFRKMRRFRRFARGIRMGRRGFYPGWRNTGGNRAELKYVDSLVNENALEGTSATPVRHLQCLSLIGEGSGIGQRIGRQVTVRKLMFKFYVRMAGTVTAPNTDTVGCRVIIFADRMLNGAEPTLNQAAENTYIGTLLEVSTTPGMLVAGVNLSNRNRFKIIKDWFFGMSCGTGGKPIFTKKFNKRMKKVITWGGTGSAVTDINTNAIFVAAITNATATTQELQIYGRARLRFTDV